MTRTEFRALKFWQGATIQLLKQIIFSEESQSFSLTKQACCLDKLHDHNLPYLKIELPKVFMVQL